MLRKIALLLVIGSMLSGILPTSIAAAGDESRVVGGPELAAAAVEAAKQRLADVEGEAVVNPDVVPPDIIVPDGELKLSVEFPYGLRLAGLTAATVNVQVDGRQVAVASVKLDIKLYRDVLVAAKPLAAREIITADTLRRERRDVGKLAGGYFADEQAAIGLAARRALAPGTVISEAVVAKPVIIRRGSIISLIARGGGVEVVAAGQALQDGSADQVIRVQNVQSKKILSAKVLDDSAALVLTFRGK